MTTKTAIPRDVLKNYLIDWTTDELGRDARFIVDAIRFRQRDGEPNWDANIGIATPPVVAAFGRALARLQREHDIAW